MSRELRLFFRFGLHGERVGIYGLYIPEQPLKLYTFNILSPSALNRLGEQPDWVFHAEATIMGTDVSFIEY